MDCKYIVQGIYNMEYLDVVDENDNLTGEKKDRNFIHNNNLYHRHASCWILNYEGDILLQRRALTKSKRPGIWSKTGGHVKSGESVIDAIKREVKEEIGLELKDKDLFFMQKFKSNNPNFFSYGYIALTHNKIGDYKLQIEEVDMVRYYKIEELEKQKRNNNKLFDFCYWQNDDFFNQMRILKIFRNDNLKQDSNTNDNM